MKNKLVTIFIKTKRNYVKRMLNDKIICMKEAKKYSKNYWDGDRKYGYGGYKYIPGRWGQKKKIIKKYNLKIFSNLCWLWKRFLLYEIKKILPGIIYGIDISKYALKGIKNF